MQVAVGSRIGDFVVVEQISQGRSGQVWRAHNHRTAADEVALKVFDRPDMALLEADRLRNTASVPGIGKLVADGPGWLATQWVDGRTLADLITADGPFGIERTLGWIDQLAVTIDELHELGLAHGDLSPSNAIVDDYDRVTLIGLGSATTAADQVPPRYASPEIASGAPAGPSSDRYALALIAYEALVGESPFPPASDSTTMLDHHVSSRPAPISEAAPRFGTRYDRLFERALSKTPAARHRDAGSFVAELRSPPDATDREQEREREASRWWKLAAAWLIVGTAAVTVVLAITGSRMSETSADVTVTPTPTSVPTPTPTPTPTPVILPPSPKWPAGMAAGFACNLAELPGFEQDRLPDNWYQGDPANSITLVSGAGVDHSTALRVGAGANYGLVAARVPVVGGDSYHFSAWIRRQGAPSQSGMWLEFESAAYEPVEGGEKQMFGPFDGLQNAQGRRVTRLFDVPADAAWAIPTFFKDASTGSVLVDEVVFGPASACSNVPT